MLVSLGEKRNETSLSEFSLKLPPSSNGNLVPSGLLTSAKEPEALHMRQRRRVTWGGVTAHWDLIKKPILGWGQQVTVR